MGGFSSVSRVSAIMFFIFNGLFLQAATANQCQFLSHQEITERCVQGQVYQEFRRVEDSRDWNCGRKLGIFPTYILNNADYEIGIGDGKVSIVQTILFTGFETASSDLVARTQARLERAFEAHRDFLRYHSIDAYIDFTIQRNGRNRVNPRSFHVEINLHKGCGRSSVTNFFLFEDLKDETCLDPGNLQHQRHGQASFNRMVVHELLHTLDLDDEYQEEGHYCKPYRDRDRPSEVECPDGRSCTNIMKHTWEKKSLSRHAIAKDSFFQIIKPLCPNACD